MRLYDYGNWTEYMTYHGHSNWYCGHVIFDHSPKITSWWIHYWHNGIKV